MFPSFNTAVSGLQQFQQQIGVIGNNIANVNTVGYKDSRTNFEDTFSQALTTGNAGQVGTGVSTSSVQNMFAQGVINRTGQDTDLAIAGQGFFVVRNPLDGSTYVTRAGDFKLDNNNYLITQNGFRVQGYNADLSTIGDIQIDTTGAPVANETITRYDFQRDGSIQATLSGGSTFTRGKVLLQGFRAPDKLVKEGMNLYSMTTAAGALAQPASPQSNGLGSLEGRALEMSTVDLTGEMSDLITAQRAFQANARMITTSDEVLQEVVNLKR
jgi:flagellar hook protein FlgE